MYVDTLAVARTRMIIMVCSEIVTGFNQLHATSTNFPRKVSLPVQQSTLWKRLFHFYDKFRNNEHNVA